MNHPLGRRSSSLRLRPRCKSAVTRVDKVSHRLIGTTLQEFGELVSGIVGLFDD